MSLGKIVNGADVWIGDVRYRQIVEQGKRAKTVYVWLLNVLETKIVGQVSDALTTNASALMNVRVRMIVRNLSRNV